MNCSEFEVMNWLWIIGRSGSSLYVNNRFGKVLDYHHALSQEIKYI